MTPGGRPEILVEFVGAPGVGKSTLGQLTAATLRADGITVRQPTERIQSAPVPVRVSTKLWYAARSILASPRAGATATRGIVGTGSTPAERLRLSLNWLYVDGVSREFGRRAGVTVLDQGPFQAYWSLVLGGDERSADQFAKLLERRYAGTTSVVVVVTADADTITDRLRTRDSNPSRVDPSDGMYDVEEAMLAVEEAKALVERTAASTPGLGVIVLGNDCAGSLHTNVERVAERVRSLHAD